MGRDKARLPLQGVTAAVHLASMLADLFEEVLLVGGDPPGGATGRPVPDPEGPRCALRGLVGALEAASQERILVVATDLLSLSPPLLLALLAWPEADAVVPRTEAKAHPLCALYRREPVRTVARRRLAAGQLSLAGLLEEIHASYLEGPDLQAVDPDGSALFNANTPEELEQLRERLRDRGR
jgi:molybdopterin-guanine dinucleotide biosynthesis protein A